MDVREINQAGMELIKSFESCSLQPYKDSRGMWTIGYGHTLGVTGDYPNITQEQADALLRQDLAAAEGHVLHFITAELDDNQFAAIVSLTYNCGTAPLLGTLGQDLNDGYYDDAAAQILRWDHCNGQVVEGLTRRRKAEYDLFNT